MDLLRMRVYFGQMKIPGNYIYDGLKYRIQTIAVCFMEFWTESKQNPNVSIYW